METTMAIRSDSRLGRYIGALGYRPAPVASRVEYPAAAPNPSGTFSLDLDEFPLYRRPRVRSFRRESTLGRFIAALAGPPPRSQVMRRWSAAVPYAHTRHRQLAPAEVPDGLSTASVPELLISVLVNARALALIFATAKDSIEYPSAGQFVTDAQRLLADADRRVHDLDRDLERASGGTLGRAPASGADLTMARVHADALVRDLTRTQLRRFRIPLSRIRSTAHYEVVLHTVSWGARELASQLADLGIDASGVDLTSISAENPRYLAGVIWNEETRWPAELSEWVSHHSRELGSGRRQVIDSDDPSATQAMPVLLISLRSDGRRIARVLAAALDLTGSGDLTSNPGLAARLSESFADARDRALDLAATLDRGLAQVQPIKLARKARRLAIDLKNASDLANEIADPPHTRGYEWQEDTGNLAAGTLSRNAEKARDTARDIAIELLLLPTDASGVDLSGIDIDDPDLLDGVIWTEETRWPSALAQWVRGHSQEIGQGLYRVAEGTEREEAKLEPQCTPTP
jgi:hypothetical protein